MNLKLIVVGLLLGLISQTEAVQLTKTQALKKAQCHEYAVQGNKEAEKITHNLHE